MPITSINYPQMLFGNKLSGNGQAQGPVPAQLSFSGIYKIEMGHYFLELVLPRFSPPVRFKSFAQILIKLFHVLKNMIVLKSAGRAFTIHRAVFAANKRPRFVYAAHMVFRHISA